MDSIGQPGDRPWRGTGSGPLTAHTGGRLLMIWESPDFIEVKMDAEINSYQDDFERESDDRF